MIDKGCDICGQIRFFSYKYVLDEVLFFMNEMALEKIEPIFAVTIVIG